MAEFQQPEEAVIDFNVLLQEMQTDMRLFSLSMRSLYSDEAVGTSSETAQEFRQLRDNTRNNVVVFLEVILPLSTNFVASISNYFECYTALTYDQWCERLSDIRLEIVSYKEQATTLLETCKKYLVSLKKRQDEASVIVAEIQDLQSKFEEIRKEYEARANTNRDWASALLLRRDVDKTVIDILTADAEKDVVQAIALKAKSEIYEAAAITVKESLMPALAGFTNGVKKAVGFFSGLEQELTNFEGKAERGMRFRMQLYFEGMNNQAEDMKRTCQLFDAVLSNVRTDFESIPTEGTDQNYIDT